MTTYVDKNVMERFIERIKHVKDNERGYKTMIVNFFSDLEDFKEIAPLFALDLV
jgi:hypothetical protein